MPLTPEQKRANKIARKLEDFRAKMPQRCLRETAKVFQEMIRAEAGATTNEEWCVVGGAMRRQWSPLGSCVCVTCGAVYPWRGSNKMDSGHFASGRYRSIIFEKANCHSQCSHCNQHREDADGDYLIYMRYVYGQSEVDRLQRLKNVTVQIDREDLAERYVTYKERIRAAEKVMGG